MNELLKKFDSAEDVYTTEAKVVAKEAQWIEEEIILSSRVDTNNYVQKLRFLVEDDLKYLQADKPYTVEALEIESNINDYQQRVLELVFEFVESIAQMEKLEVKTIKRTNLKIYGSEVNVNLEIQSEEDEKKPFFRTYKVPFGSWKISYKNKIEIKASFNLDKYEEAKSKIVRKERESYV